MTLTHFVSGVTGPLVALLSVNWIYYKILKIAFQKRLVDNPDVRKLQKRPVPVVGGLAVFFGVIVGLMAASMCHTILEFDIPSSSLFPIICAMGLMLYVGAMDDVLGLSPKSRFIIEIAAVLGMIFDSGLCIDSFHGLWGISTFSWWIAVPLTIFAGVGIINAINMIDGVNGLSSGLCMVYSVLFGLLFYKAQDFSNAVLAFTIFAAMIPFYIHNVFGNKSRMFIGDAGTMVIGILMTWFVICSISRKSFVSDYLVTSGINTIAMALAILSVPVFDTLRVMAMRIFSKKSPFNPDKTHLHHAFVNVGISHFITSSVEILLGIIITGIWGVSLLCGAGLDLQLYIVIIVSMLFVWGTYAFLRYHVRHHTELLHRIIGFSVRTHLGRTQWWKTITNYLDKPGDYLDLDLQQFDTDSISDYVEGINLGINYKEKDRKLVLDYLKGKAEVYVDDIMAHSGAESLRVYPLLFEEAMAGTVVVIKENTNGIPLIVALKDE